MKIIRVEYLFLNGSARIPFSFQSLIDEIKELGVEIVKLRSKGMVEELDDVYVFFCLWLYSRFGWNVYMIETPSVRKFVGRIGIWRKMFRLVKVKFLHRALIGGSNYNRPHKIVRAFAEVGHEIGLDRVGELLKKAKDEV